MGRFPAKTRKKEEGKIEGEREGVLNQGLARPEVLENSGCGASA